MEINDQIEQFSPITLEEMEKVKLMNRIDIKYIFNDQILANVLNSIKDDYYILVAGGTSIANYITLYFDTNKNQLYLHHHNGKRNRYKVRYREYVDSKITFFEIKYKNNKGRVIKDRVKVDSIKQVLGEEELKLLHKKVSKKIVVEPRLENRFNRITLVAKEGIERATLDFNLRFKYSTEIEGIPSLAIAEIKQERYSRTSKIMQVLREFGVRPDRMSKYAIGMSIFSGEKANNFKEKRIRINKITKDDH
jgi:hypothetical protein